MSLAIVTGIGTTVTETGITVETLSTAPFAAWGVAMLAALKAADKFGQVWNKTRNKIPYLEANLKKAQQDIVDAGVQYLQPTTQDISNNFNQYLEEAKKVDLLLQTSYATKITDLSNQIKSLDSKALELYQMWVTTLSLLHIAGSDNAFYTINKDDIDKLIGAYTSNPVEVDALIEVIKKIVAAWLAIKAEIESWLPKAQTIAISILDPPISTFPERPADNVDEIIKGLGGFAGLKGTELIRDLINEINNSIARTRVRTRTRTREARFKLPKRFPNKKTPRKKPEHKIKYIEMDTSNSSEWIRKITFTFPQAESMESNSLGTMRFHMKKGGVITKVRVKRGTFSVIALWSIGTKLGVGYRYWSQFNKKAIVNRDKVLSWVIPIINANDRNIAIPLERLQKMIKYK